MTFLFLETQLVMLPYMYFINGFKSISDMYIFRLVTYLFLETTLQNVTLYSINFSINF